MQLFHCIFLFLNYRYVPPSPAGLVEDIAEIMHKERQEEDSINESMYETDSSMITAGKTAENNNKKAATDDAKDSATNKRVRKSLETTWETSTDMPYLAETPVRFLLFYISKFLQYKHVQHSIP